MESVRRRRKCSECKRRFTTYEKSANPSIRVIKRSGASEPFDSKKIDSVVLRLSKSRKLGGPDNRSRISRTIEADIVDEGVRMIPSWSIASRLLELLEPIDRVVHHRLRANYLDENGELRLGKATPTDGIDQLSLFNETIESKD